MNAEIAELHGQGVSQRQIARQLGISRRQVGNALHNRTEVNFILNDLHWPYQDDQAISVALKVADLAEPDIITLNGDVSDFYEISDFVKSKSQTRASIGEEIDNLRNFLASLRGRYPKARIVYIAGNHEYRWDRYIATNAQKIQGLRGISLEEQIGVGEQDIEWKYSGLRESAWQWGKLLIGHFNKTSKHSAYTAKGLIDDKGISLIQAHVHRGGLFYKRVWDKQIVGVENYCLCDLNPPYLVKPNWQQGFSLVYRQGDIFHVETHPILNGRTFFRGQLITA